MHEHGLEKHSRHPYIGFSECSPRKEKEGAERTFLHRGIAARDFEQRFQLANHVKVTGATFDDGMRP